MLRRNVAGQHLFFLLLDAAGAPVTGATVTARRSIDGAAQAACTGTVAEPGNGQYRMNLSQADTDGNSIGYLFTAATAIPAHIGVLLTAADPTNATSYGIARLDAAVSADTAGTATLLSRVTSGRASNLDFLNTNLATAFTAQTAEHDATQAAISVLGGSSDSPGVTTLLGRVTDGRAANLDKVDVLVSSIGSAPTSRRFV